ncbi:MAG TPA: hypothetical protein VJR03_14455 [Nitrospira sp.]|nr:hypothetical protein [Nitrospira sp.]
MISTFDLTLLGTLVCAGGLMFLRLGKWPFLRVPSLGIGRQRDVSAESRNHHTHSAALAAARWLTVGVLTLFVAYAHGADEGFLFDPWTDVAFHLIFVSACWTMTAYRMKQAAEQAASVHLITVPAVNRADSR